MSPIGLNTLPISKRCIDYASLHTKPLADTLRMKSQPLHDTFHKLSFDDIYEIIKIKDGRIKLIPKIAQHNGEKLLPFEFPEYLYHITSEENMKLIRSTDKLRCTLNEQLPGVYLLDKENLLTKYIDFGKQKRNLCLTLLEHVNSRNKNSSNLFVIRIPAESLLRNGKLRIRTQEDFFHYQDKILELQKNAEKSYLLRSLANDEKRSDFIKYVLENKLMTKSELEQFMDDMKQKIHHGYFPKDVAELENNYAIEYIFNRDISPDFIHGIKTRRFSFNECVNAENESVNLENLRKILDF